MWPRPLKHLTLALILIASRPEWMPRIVAQVHGLSIGQIGDDGNFKFPVLVETIQHDLIADLWREALILSVSPGAAGDFDGLAAGHGHCHPPGDDA